MSHKTVRVAVVDSGIDDLYDLGPIARDECVSFISEGGDIPGAQVQDQVGHGTAVSSMIHQFAPDASIIPVQVFDRHNYGADILRAALEYIRDNIICDIVHISLGVTCLSDIQGFRALCSEIVAKGILIVSALDNRGMISYPAAFPCVIGVDSNLDWRDWSQYALVEGGEMNIIGCRREQRVSWLGGTSQIVSGSSFTAAYFTGVICGLIAKHGTLTMAQTLLYLREKALRTIKIDEIPMQKIGFPIYKAIAFPFNKEMHSLARFRSLLAFPRIDFYDIGYLGQVGKSLQALDWLKKDDGLLLRNYNAIDWNGDFDTFILGHIRQIEKTVGKEYVEDIVAKCVEYDKKLYSFFDITDRIQDQYKEKLRYDYPHIDSLDSRRLTLKMHDLGVPIIGVVGTDSRQGKFTAQLALRGALLEQGYKVGQMGTEPSSLLFGMDKVYPMGYEGSVHVSGFDAVYTANRMMGQIEAKEPDLILFGTQGQVHMLYPAGYAANTAPNHEFLLGCQADAYILCVNGDDAFEDIEQTIGYLHTIYNAQVLALVLSPMVRNAKWSVVNNTKNLMNADLLETCKASLEKRHHIPVFTLKGPEDANALAELCICFFS